MKITNRSLEERNDIEAGAVKLEWHGCPVWLAPLSTVRIGEHLNGAESIVIITVLGVPKLWTTTRRSEDLEDED